jgi:hypothetical protein
MSGCCARAADLYQLLELDKRADRILPHGWCLLPPRVRAAGNRGHS